MSGTKTIFFLLAIVLLFLFLNSPIPVVAQMSQFNLLLLGTLGVFGIMILSEEKRNPFAIKRLSDFVSGAAIGIILGAIGFVVIGFFLHAITGIVNLLGTVSATEISAFNTTQLFFIALIFPLTETILLVGGTLVLAGMLRGKIPYPIIISALVIMLAFAMFHFNDKGRLYYEFSPAGFINFVGETKGFGTPDYHGALPQFILGGFWIAIALMWNSWVVAWFAHAISNIISLILIIGLNPILLILLFLCGGLVFLSWQKTGLRELQKYNIKAVIS